MIDVINKWNGKSYKADFNQDGTVTIIRTDGSKFKIAKVDFNFNYKKV